MPISAGDLAEQLSGLATEVRCLAYTGSCDKENALLGIAERLKKTAAEVRRLGAAVASAAITATGTTF